MTRWILFFITIALGAAAGLYYGWSISPVEYVDTAPDTLRQDYKSDFTLMVAEAYAADGDLELAMRRLALLGDPLPLQTVVDAIRFAENAPYGPADMAALRRLEQALREWNPALEIPTP